MKKKSIIEKLGITTKHRNGIVNGHIIIDLEKQRNELLEALIISIEHDHRYFDGFFIDWSMDNLKHLVFCKWGEKGSEVYDDFIRSISAIQKTTNKTWEEIQELIQEN